MISPETGKAHMTKKRGHLGPWPRMKITIITLTVTITTIRIARIMPLQ
jgi:hypothetical protein